MSIGYNITGENAETWESIGVNMFYMDIKRYYFNFLLLLLAFAAPINLCGQSKLQQYLDKLAINQSTGTKASSTPTDIDLSEFDSDITETVYVRNGINVRFVNGTITRNESLNGPLVKVQDNSELTIGKDAVLTGMFKGNDLVLVDGGSLFCEAGRIEYLNTSANRNLSETPSVFAIQDYCDKPIMRFKGCVVLTNTDDLFEMTGGYVNYISGGKGIVKILGGGIEYVEGENMVISGGIVSYVQNKGYTSLEGGEINKVRGTNVSLSGKFLIKDYLYLEGDDDIAYITGSFSGNVVIHTRKKEGETLVQGKDYNITEEDLERIKAVRWVVNCHKELKLKLVDNEVVIANEKEIKDAQTLQEALDAVAAKNLNPWERETIEIPAEGIEIDETIYFRKNCRVILKGGPIKISSNFKIPPTVAYPYYAFLTEAKSAVEFQDITLDFNNNNIFKRCLFEINGMFSVKNNVEFKNIDKNIDLLYGVFYMKDGCYFSYDNYKSEINVNPTVFYGEGVQEAYFNGFAASYNKPVVNSQSIFNVTGGKIQSNYAPYSIKCSYLHIGGDAYLTSVSETVAEAEYIYIDGGYVSGKCLEAKTMTITSDKYTHHFYLDKIAIKDVLSIYGNINIECPVSFENVDSRITINQAITCTSKIKFISPCWKDLLNKPLISGTTKYPLPDNILNDFDFSESGYKAVLDKEKNCVILKKKSLQDALDDAKGNGGGTSDNPIEFDLPDEEEVESDIHFPGGLQGFLDGLADTENDDNNPKQLKLGGGCVFVDKNCALTIRNYILDGCSSGKRIYVDGTLTIDVNVYIRYFSDYFIHVRQGGCVIWRGGRTEVVNKVIYNEGGTIIIESGEINSDGGSAIENVGGTIEIFGGETSKVVVNGTITNGTIYYGGTIRIYGGSYNGPITNYGTLYIYDGTYNNGGVSSTVITNYGELHINGGIVIGEIYGYSDFHLCGCANVGNIYLRGGSTIYITERLTEKIHIQVFIEGDIDSRVEIVIGSDYVLTEDDLNLIELVLPEGYEWEYDSIKHAVIIKTSTGINGVTTDEENCIYDIYSLQGVKVGTTADKTDIPDGIYVIGGKKTILKNKVK